MDDRALLDAMWSNTALVRALGHAGAGAQLVERDGLVAAVVPVCPECSVINSVAYAEPAGLVDAYDELAGVYDAAGIEAWTVWVPEADAESAAFLERRGHVRDAAPMGMGAPLDQVAGPSGDFPGDLSREPDPALLGKLNDRAYGYEGSFERALGGISPGAAHWYTAFLEGEPVSGLVIFDDGGDAEVDFVATVPEARGRGLAGALMARALADARERGRVTTTIVATKMGQSVYERMGYRPLGTVEMWERRRTAAA